MPEPRDFDHFVLPVGVLAEARARFASLGFTVAADAKHPFGTENCCIFLADGTFIEPLAIADRELYDAAINAGNAFVTQDRRFRATGQHGFSQLVIKSEDAASDDAHYSAGAVSGGRLLDFSRHFTKADGTQGEVAFRLAFASPPQKAGAETNVMSAGFFACEVRKAMPGGRGALVDHANGAKKSIAVIATAADPMAMDGFLEMFLETQSTAGTEVYYPAASAGLRVMQPDVFHGITGVEPPQTDTFCLAALVIGVVSLDELRIMVRQNNITHHEKPGWLIVPPAAGQPVTLMFQSPE
jgi:hypothetical protein